MNSTIDPRSNDDKPAPQRGTDDDDNAKVNQGGTSAPRLPHERDESSDSQQPEGSQQGAMGQKGHDDVERGVVDTSRGAETDRVYNEQVKR